MNQKKWQSKPLWVAVGALIMLLMGNYGLYALIGMDAETFKAMFELILSIAVLYGIINNPNDSEKL